MNIKFKILILAALAAIILIMALSRGDNQSDYFPLPEYKIVKKQVHDTIYVPCPEPAEVIYVPVPDDIDTLAIIESYFTQNIYVDTVHAGEYVDLKITDSLSCNRLLSHKIELLSLPEVVTIHPSAGSARCAALGALIGKNLMILKCDLHLRNSQFSAGYDFYNKGPVVGYSYKALSW